VTKKKSPKPTRYIRIRSSFESLGVERDFFRCFDLRFATSISPAAVSHREIDRKAIGVTAFDQAKALKLQSLARLAKASNRTIALLADHKTVS
jgi:hypothetical protein